MTTTPTRAVPGRTARPGAAATRSTLHRTRTIGLTGIALAGLLLSGCNSDNNTPTAPGPLVSSAQPGSAPSQPHAPGDDASTDASLAELIELNGLDALTGLDELDSTLESSSSDGGFTLEEVRRLDQLDTPAGSVTDIAVRFLQALAVQDWRAAAHELNLPARFHLSFRTPDQLVAILNDVRRQTGPQHLIGCDQAQRIKSNAVVVTCDGGHRVVVHVQNLVLRGVQISPDHPLDDVVHGPHTHAFTSLMP